MGNTIALAKKYTSLLDEVYIGASVTADLTSDASWARAGVNANEIVYPQVAVTGLGDYDRNAGYTNATVDVQWKTVQFNYDRGAKIAVDTMDDEETFNIAFGRASSTLMREKVAPEADAFTFATLAGKAGISIADPATYADATEFLTALLVAKNRMDEDEVPEENRILYATPTLMNSIIALDTYKSREVLNAFSKIVKVPQSRFYTGIELLDGRTAGEEAGHYKKAAGAADINFLIVHKPAVLKFDKHVVSSIISPENNPDADAYITKYRKYGLVDVLNNKLAGIYLSAKAVG